MKRQLLLTKIFILLVLSSFHLSTLYGQKLPEIKFEKYILPNGLQVILHEDHSVPMVSVNIWYHVGSKNEKRGRTGFAHLFEHLMFEGSENVPEGMFDKWLEAAGGDNNGSTSEDRTNYWENVPSNALELALYLESDRMANLLAAIDQEKLDTQRDVVKNERRQGVENQPYGRAYEVGLEALYPYNHPYSWPVIGSMEDLSAASLEDVKDFFKRFYTPNNASLSIAGDIDPEETKALVEKYFANIPPGPPVERIEHWVPELEGLKRIELKDNVSLPRVYMAWHTPPLYQPGDAALDILASILSSGKNSRLYKSLVYENQIAQDVRAYQASREIASVFYIVATAKPGHTLVELEKAIDTELSNIINNPAKAEEVATAVNAYEASFIRRLQSVGGFGGKADKLNQYNVYLGNPDYFSEDLNRYLNITPEAVQKVAQNYLNLNKRIIMYVEPAGDLNADKTIEVDRRKVPAIGLSPKLMHPSFEEQTLANGLKVLVAEHHELPLVQFNLIINAGWTADPTDKPGVSSLTSDLQDEGTKNRSTLEISQDLKVLGASMGTSSSFDASYMTLNTLKKHLSKSLEIFSDVLMNPTFPDHELERIKKEYLAQILQEKRQPFTASFKNFLRTLYGKDHPYGQPYTGTGTEESIKSITNKDLKQFYKTYFHPNNATLIVVGDVTADEIVPVLEKALKNWKKQDVPTIDIPLLKRIEGNQIYLIDKPGAPQSVIVTGHFGLLRNSPDYYKVQVMNAILGGKFTSRLNMNLREDKGYTYGAGSFFMDLKGMGPFLAYTQVHTQYTKETLVEMLKEYRGMAGEIPISEEELSETKKYITLRYPGEFETISQIAGKLGEIVTYDLPRDYFNQYVQAIEKVSAADVIDAAKKYIHPDKMLFVIVGDVEKIEPGIRELSLGEIHYLDLDGNPINR
jgi:zinc protease